MNKMLSLDFVSFTIHLFPLIVSVFLRTFPNPHCNSSLQLNTQDVFFVFFFSGQDNGLKHVSQWDEKLSGILKLYQEKKELLSNMQTKHPKAKAGKVNVDIFGFLLEK